MFSFWILLRASLYSISDTFFYRYILLDLIDIWGINGLLLSYLFFDLDLDRR